MQHQIQQMVSLTYKEIKMKNVFVKKYSIALFLLLVFWLQSCKDVNNPEDNAPTLPAQSTMLIDFSEFPDTTTVSILPKTNETASYQYWGWAALNVKYWNTLIAGAVVIPVAAFSEAFNHQPVLQNDGSWLWSYNYTVGANQYTAKLYGSPSTSGIDWSMLLSKAGEYSDFEWFTGYSNLPATDGYWDLNKDPNQPEAFLKIEWARNSSGDSASVKYTNVIPGNAENGAYIQYGKTSDIPYNRYYKIWSQQYFNLTDILWNFENHFGRVNDPRYFGTPDWYCWDELLMDTSCQ